MKGDGNTLSTLLQKLYFYIIPTSTGRTKYIVKHKSMFHNIGENFFFQPRKFPADPEYLSFGNNVKISAGVTFINHDITYKLFNDMKTGHSFVSNRGCIEIGNNVMIGANVMILPNVKIGNNVIIGAGAIVTKDIPDNSVAAGIPCRVIGRFDEFLEKRKSVKTFSSEDDYWNAFNDSRS